MCLAQKKGAFLGQIPMKKKQAGFSLIELLIVVAIILVIAAIAIPNFMASRMAANESSSVQEMRAITTAEVVYHTQYGIGYSAQLSYLGDGGTATSTQAGLIDSVLASGKKSGYNFVYTPGLADSNGNYVTYTLNGNPVTLGATGRRYFFTDQTAVIRQNYTAAATIADPAI
jgi:prepilin-type N-terminal cleavage/methylation domain-containing protein